MFISGGLLLIHTSILKHDWDPPFKAYRPVVFFFFISNVFLVFAPLVPPAGGFRPYESLPYWVCFTAITNRRRERTDSVLQLHVVVATSASLIGVSYWYVWTRWLPARGSYRLVREQVIGDDGSSRSVLKKVAYSHIILAPS